MAGAEEVEAEKKRAAGTASRAEAVAVGAVAMVVMLALAGKRVKKAAAAAEEDVAEAGNRAEPKRQARTARRCIGARERGREGEGEVDGCVLVSGFEVVRLCVGCVRASGVQRWDGLRVRKERGVSCRKPSKCTPSQERSEV